MKSRLLRGRVRYIGSLARFAVLCGLLSLLVVPPSAHATTALLFDAETGQVLHAEKPDRPWYPASLTKLMTAYVAFDVMRETQLSDQTVLRLSEHANAQEPTKLWLYTDTKLKLSTVIGAMIVKSANDAAVMAAEGVGHEVARFTRFGGCLGPGRKGIENGARRLKSPPHPMEIFSKRKSGLGAARYDDAIGPWVHCRYQAFIHRMNTTAHRLGMLQSSFVNSNGLPDSRQVTNARDMARLTHALIRDFPDFAPVFAARSMRYSGGRLRSYNALLRTYTGADGMKTGFICASCYNIVASATRDGRRLVAVVLGWSQASKRNARAAALLEYGFRIPPTMLGPHDLHLTQFPSFGFETVPPQDIRASLRSRSCRRGSGRRIRFRARDVVVRALIAPNRPRRRTTEQGSDGIASTSRGARPKPERVSKKLAKRTSRKRKARGKKQKKKAGKTRASAAAAAHTTVER